MDGDNGTSASSPDPGWEPVTALNGDGPHVSFGVLKLAVDQIPGVALLSFDQRMRFSAVAGGGLARHGYAPQDIIGRCPRELGAGWAVLEERFAQALAGERDGPEPLVDFSPDGKSVYEAVISALRDRQGRITGGVLVMLRGITAEGDAEAALAGARGDCGAIVEQSADMLTRHDEEGFFTYVSPACVPIYGRGPGELIGRHPLEFAHLDDVDGVKASLTGKALVEGDCFEVAYRVLPPDGSCVWVHATVRVYVDESGRRFVVGATRDVSAQRSGEDALAEGERQARGLIEFSGDMHSRTDADGRLVYVSPNCQQVVGYRPEQLLGQCPHHFTHPADRERYDAITGEACEHGASEIEYRFRRPDGRYMWLHVLLRARYDEQGQLVEIVRAVRDITKRKHAENALEEERRLLYAFLETTPDQVYFKDLHGRFVRVSSVQAAKLGFNDPEDAIGKSDFDAFSDEHASQALTDERRIIDTGEPIIGLEERETFPDGRVAWVSTSKLPLRNADGQIIGTYGISRDITAQRAAEQGLAEAERQARTVIELSGDLHTRTDADGILVYASPNSVDVIGWRPEELVGRRPSDFAHPEDVELSIGSVRTAAKQGAAEVEHRIGRPDGSYVWINSLLRARYDEEGRLIEIVRAARDISAQKAAEAELARAEQQFRAVIEQSGDVLSRHDASGRYVYVSPRCTQITGYTPDQLIGHRPHEFVYAEDRSRVEAASREARRTGEAQVEHRLIRADGSLAWVHALLHSRRDEQGRVLEFVVAVRDVSDRKAQEARLREATERFEHAFERAPIGMALVDLDGAWIKVNRALCGITGYSESELLARRFADLTHPDDLQAGREEFEECVAGTRDAYAVEKRYVRADARVIWIAVSASVIHDQAGRPVHFVSQIQDVTERREFEQRLSYLADHDSLTKLYNRRRFESELERQVALSRRYGEQAALVVLDLDHFKYLNDALGHKVGDKLIRHVGKVLKRRLRRADILARQGGDEFAVILSHVDSQLARRLAAEFVACIEQCPFAHDGHRYVLSASAGVVVLDQGTASAEDALVSADIALYDAKQQGRNRAAVFSAETRQDVLAGLTWSQLLKDALAHDHFILHAQPIVSLQTGETVMRELLIRMTAEDGELVPPNRFLPAAARFGYMPQIDRWVITQAARLAAEEPGRCLAVNLAANTIAEPGLVAFITNTLKEAAADPADLVFELSEADVIANLDHARSVCEHLRALGARIALDDFGSGFSGFSYLKAIQIDLLKIDGEFVKELATNRVDQLIIEATLHIATGMGLPTVAEYVTDEPVAQLLREMGATYGQGFHLGKPAPLKALTPSPRG